MTVPAPAGAEFNSDEPVPLAGAGARRIVDTFVHETSHIIVSDYGAHPGTDTDSGSFGRYKDEFREYWIEPHGSFSSLAPVTAFLEAVTTRTPEPIIDAYRLCDATDRGNLSANAHFLSWLGRVLPSEGVMRTCITVMAHGRSFLFFERTRVLLSALTDAAGAATMPEPLRAALRGLTFEARLAYIGLCREDCDARLAVLTEAVRGEVARSSGATASHEAPDRRDPVRGAADRRARAEDPLGGARPDRRADDLEITATREETVMASTIQGGPGPTQYELPGAGCWTLDLQWAGRKDRLRLAYRSADPG